MAADTTTLTEKMRAALRISSTSETITLYCKAEFGFNNAAEQFRKSYDALKMRLSLSAEYNTAPQVSETDTNSTESGV